MPEPRPKSAEETPAKAAEQGPRGFSREEFRELPLTLAARIATGTATLESLRSLAPGSVLPLDTPIGEASRLIAQGAVVGAGEIVEVKGRLALRLTRLGKDNV